MNILKDKNNIGFVTTDTETSYYAKNRMRIETVKNHTIIKTYYKINLVGVLKSIIYE